MMHRWSLKTEHSLYSEAVLPLLSHNYILATLTNLVILILYLCFGDSFFDYDSDLVTCVTGSCELHLEKLRSNV